MELAGLLDGLRRDGHPTRQPPRRCEVFARIGGNLDYFFAHGLKPISFYAPDVETLRASPVRIVIGVGERSARATRGTHRAGVG